MKPHALALALVAAAYALLAVPAHAEDPVPSINHHLHLHLNGRAHKLVYGHRRHSRPRQPVSCSTGVTSCAGFLPTNEPWIATNGTQFVAGANDYNSYNGQGQDGFYWSSDGVTWNDDGPLDVFPHSQNAAAGDPGLAIDAAGVVYYSSLFFDPNDCSVGGVELMRKDPATGNWTYRQLAGNSSTAFEDKPAIALGPDAVYVSWSHFGSCTGENVSSPIQVAVLPTGAQSVAPTAVLSVPGSTYSQGSSLAADGAGGFWVSWEEFPTAGSASGEIRLAHHTPAGWATLAGGNAWETISPPSFKDIPSPLSGFQFRTDSFPALTLVGGAPWVVWASADSGVGRVHLWSGGPGAPAVSDTGGDQFFPAVAADGSGGAFVSYGQTAPNGTYDWYLAHGATVQRVSQVSSTPNDDPFFSGQFVGDYSSIAVRDGAPYPIWTEVVPGGFFTQMQTVVFAGGRPAAAPGVPVLAAPTAGNGRLHLQWTAPADNGGSAITGYRVYRGTSAGTETLLDTVTGTSYDDTTVAAGTTYWYRVSAVNANGEGALSNEVSATSDLTVPIVPGGSPVTVTTTFPNENVRLSFTGVAGQRVAVQLSGSTIAFGTLSILNPDGTTLTSKPFAGAGFFLDPAQLPVGGTYTVLLAPGATSVGSVTVQAYLVPADATASIAPGGAPVTIATSAPGQNARLMFNGFAGETVALQLGGVSISSGNASLLRPDGTTLATKPFAVNGLFLDATVLPVTGTYTILLDPSGSSTGAATATLYDVPPDVTGTLTQGGPSVSVTTTVPGQNARLTFTGGAGEVVGLNVSGVTMLSASVSVLRPDGTTLTTTFFSSSGVFVSPPALPVAGKYTVLVDPQSNVVGSATLKLTDVPTDVTGTISAGGPPVSFTTATPGQNARFTFSGSAGESVAVQLSGVTISNGMVSILRPDGTTIAIKPFNSTSGAFVDRTQLTSAGTYTIFVDPSSAAVGAATVALYDVPPDVSGTITAGGPPVRVTTTVPGQNALLSFNGSAGQTVTVSLGGVSFPSAVLSVVRPGGLIIATRFLFSSGGSVTVTLPVAGTYTILVDPTDASIGSATVTLV